PKSRSAEESKNPWGPRTPQIAGTPATPQTRPPAPAARATSPSISPGRKSRVTETNLLRRSSSTHPEKYYAAIHDRSPDKHAPAPSIHSVETRSRRSPDQSRPKV